MRTKRSQILIGLIASVILTAAPPTHSAEAKAPQIVMEEFMVPAVDPGIQLYVRNKRPQSVEKFGADKILLFVHGSIAPAETIFDLTLGGVSWMEYIAQHGYDVYLVDVRGYGKSTRPPEMDQPADQNPPIVRTETAVRDVGAAVDFILKRRGVSKLNLMGWSWGTAIMGWYTAQHNEKVNKLVLYAPRWLSNTPSLLDSGGKLGAYGTASMDSAKDRALKGVPEDKKDGSIEDAAAPPGCFAAIRFHYRGLGG